MITYSQHALDAKIATFLKKKMHQYPELRNERFYIEPATSPKPVEKHRTSYSSHPYTHQRMAHAA